MKLLLDSSKCPCCGSLTVSFDIHRCLECEVALFRADSDYGRYQAETLFKNYYVFFPPERLGLYRGWVHADKLEDARPNEGREHKAITLG